MITPDYTDPLLRLLSAPMLAHARRCSAKLTPELASIANEDSAELREHCASEYAARLPARGGKP